MKADVFVQQGAAEFGDSGAAELGLGLRRDGRSALQKEREGQQESNEKSLGWVDS
jgi:hypothetical protein